MEKTCETVTYYNGACPVCRAGIAQTRRQAEAKGADGMAWIDVSEDPGVLDPLGLQLDPVKKRLHVLDADGNMQIGVDAAITLWRAIPGQGWKARVVSTPGIYHLGRLWYDHVLAPTLFWWNRRNGR